MRRDLERAVAAEAGRGARPGNPGLVLDRYVGDAAATGERTALLRSVAEADIPPSYALRFERWRAALRSLPNTRLGVFETAGRCIVGLGNETVHETGLLLQHVDGAPYLPGSALKGLASHYLAQKRRPGAGHPDAIQRHHAIVFGDTASAGYITFFDAWYIPGTATGGRPLALDTITVHHPGYYAGQGRREPWDLDDPNPVPFLSVRGAFLVAVRGPDDAWAGFAFDLLRQALSDWGVGAKTSSGYGRLEWVQDVEIEMGPGAAGRPDHSAADHPLIQSLRALTPARVRQEIRGIVQQAERLDEPERTRVLRTVTAVLQANASLWRWAQDRPWFTIVAPHTADSDAEGNP